jgi:hypothetical protein
MSLVPTSHGPLLERRSDSGICQQSRLTVAPDSPTSDTPVVRDVRIDGEWSCANGLALQAVRAQSAWLHDVDGVQDVGDDPLWRSPLHRQLECVVVGLGSGSSGWDCAGRRPALAARSAPAKPGRRSRLRSSAADGGTPGTCSPQLQQCTGLAVHASRALLPGQAGAFGRKRAGFVHVMPLGARLCRWTARRARSTL